MLKIVNHVEYCYDESWPSKFLICEQSWVYSENCRASYYGVGMSALKKFKSTNFLLSVCVVFASLAIVGTLVLLGSVPLRVFSVFLYASMLALPVLAIVYNVLNARGLIEKGRHERALIITASILAALAITVLALAWHFT